MPSAVNQEAGYSVQGVRSVAVIGAGVSGILSTKYLLQAGLDVTVFERNSSAGGVWIFDEKPAPEPSYPAQDPLKTAQELCPWYADDVQHPETLKATSEGDAKWLTSHAPSGPCYHGLTNNFSVVAMELKDHPWPWHIPLTTPERLDDSSEWTSHDKVLAHLRNAAVKFGLEDKVLYRTLVEKVQKKGNKWELRSSTLSPTGPDEHKFTVSAKNWEFDAVVVATGHYVTPRVADIPGLKAWKEKFPDRVEHSKSYRYPQGYKGQNVLLVGGGTSSTEIARELGMYASSIYQSGRGSVFDLPIEFLPDNCQRVSEIAEFSPLSEEPRETSSSLPGSVTLKDGQVLKDIHRVIVCTGYHYSYPFLSEFHSKAPENSEHTAGQPRPLVADGTCTLNLHSDMFYIPDPTLCFAGTSLFISTFSFFEYQTMAIAAVLSGKASLPSSEEMETIYAKRLETRGATKMMNARMDEEVSYVDKLVEWLNASEKDESRHVMGFSKEWHAVRDAGKLEKIKARFAREKAEREALQRKQSS